tara:strand:- start:2015 stop:3724 length:1710 start_codon:yes stop_codon:yes gene_type:complete
MSLIVEIREKAYNENGSRKKKSYTEQWWKEHHPDIYTKIMAGFQDGMTFKEHLYRIDNNMRQSPVCLNTKCNKSTRWNDKANKYSLYCSKKCSATSEQGKETRSKNMSVLNQDKNISQKRKESLERFWESPNGKHEKEKQSKRAKEQHKNGLSESVKKYFEEKYDGSDDQKNRSRRLKDKSHPIHSNNSREKAKCTNMSKYGAENPACSDLVKRKVHVTHSEKYGCHYNQRHIKHSIDILQDRDRLMNEFEESDSDLVVLAGRLDIDQNVAHRYLKMHCIDIPQTVSKFEKEVTDFLLDNGLNVETGNRSMIPPLELDIYMPDKAIAIECNGVYWHCEASSGRDRMYHMNKYKLCQDKGIILIQINDSDWNSNKDLIKRRLVAKLGLNLEKVYARKTKVEKINSGLAKDFCEEHHFQGSTRAGLSYGLYYDNNLVSVMTFSKPRFNKKYEYELVRFCSSVSVIGGASKLFKWFLDDVDPETVVSYSDNSWNSGKVYEMLGFVKVSSGTPSYKYTRNYVDLYNRVRFQKHKLESKLDKFDPLLTEWENMQANGWDRIWDCGSSTFVYESD